MIVPRLPGDGNEGAHGKPVKQLIVEFLMGESVGCGLAFVATNGLRGKAACSARRFVQGEGFGIDAEVVLRGLTDEGLRIHGACQVSVQIGAFGHVHKESV